MITIDGSTGEGGGQILRTALGLSLVTGKPFSIFNIRAGRKKPGLMRQHLTAVNAAAEIGSAVVKGNTPGSQAFTFEPGPVRHGSYCYSIGSAGSCTLVLQTLLPALMTADGPSDIVLEGGTHNPLAPPFDFIQKAFLPVITKLGPEVNVVLEKHGFYPAGGGRFRVSVIPSKKLARIDLKDRGPVEKKHALAAVANLPLSIARRELEVVREKLALTEDCLEALEVKNAAGPGNVLSIMVESSHITEVFTAFGEKGVSSERVAKACVKEAREYISSTAAAGRYLADQLLIPMAMAGGGSFSTLSPSGHTMTNIGIIKRFLDVDITVNPVDGSENLYHVTII